MRGDAFHNLLAEEAAAVFRRWGFAVQLEHALRLPGAVTKDFVDVLARRGDHLIACEIETTPRYVLVNAGKAAQVGAVLWVIVPNHEVRRAVSNKLAYTAFNPGGRPIRILLPGQLEQALANDFPGFSPANTAGENEKTASQEAR